MMVVGSCGVTVVGGVVSCEVGEDEEGVVVCWGNSTLGGGMLPLLSEWTGGVAGWEVEVLVLSAGWWLAGCVGEG